MVPEIWSGTDRIFENIILLPFAKEVMTHNQPPEQARTNQNNPEQAGMSKNNPEQAKTIWNKAEWKPVGTVKLASGSRPKTFV